MVIADSPGKGDAVLKKNGIQVFLEKEANRLLSSATLDYTPKEGIVIGGMPQSSCCG